MIRKRSMVKTNEKGIGLVEVLAALGISVVVITSLVSLAVFTLRSSQRGKVVLEASKDANKTLELVRAFRDSETTLWSSSVDHDPNGFLNQLIDNNCYVANQGCSISTDGSGNFTVTQVLDAETAINLDSLGPDDVAVYFTADPVDGNLDLTDDTVRISVFAIYRIGNQLKSSNVYTDLTNWRDK